MTLNEVLNSNKALSLQVKSRKGRMWDLILLLNLFLHKTDDDLSGLISVRRSEKRRCSRPIVIVQELSDLADHFRRNHPL